MSHMSFFLSAADKTESTSEADKNIRSIMQRTGVPDNIYSTYVCREQSSYLWAITVRRVSVK